MFEESFLSNLCIFATGQVVAYLYLRTGLRGRGLLLMVGGWVLADFALLEKFAFQSTGYLYFGALGLMQAWSILEACYFVFARVRRRRRSVLRARKRLFHSGFLHYLRNELGSAITAYRKILKSDPWDLQAKLALATTLARHGQRRAARAALFAARNLDVAASFGDAIGDEMRRFSAPVAEGSRSESGAKLEPPAEPTEKPGAVTPSR